MKRFIYIFSIICLTFILSCKQTTTPEPGQNTPNNDYPVTKEIPAFSPIGGFFKETQTVSIDCSDAKEIYYTIITPQNVIDKENLEAPSETSIKYTGPFQVSEQCIIRAVAIKSDGTKNYAMTCFDFDLNRDNDYSGTKLESPNWQDQIIYFILTDRFYNGDTTNDKIEGLITQDGISYDESIVLPGQPASSYNGGDLKGIEQKLDYIQSLGATAIWITPPIKNQVADGNYHGFHGYWASDFTKVDEHMGTLEDYQSLVNEAHKRGMYVIQDIVVNHVGDFQKIVPQLSITAEMVKNKLSETDFKLNSQSVPYAHPTQLPWAFNNVNDLTEDEFLYSSFYNYNASIYNFTDLSQRYIWQSSDLDDMKTSNPVVQNLLRGYFRYWIDKTNIDGYRIDTVYYVEEEFFEGFINSEESGNLGIRPYAKTLGKNDFLNFGEAWSTDEKIVSDYTQSESGTPRIDSIIYFPLRFAITDTISQGSKTSNISTVLQNRYRNTSKVHYADPNRLVTFIDNHDVDRFAKVMNGNIPLIKAAYGIIFTIPGIPQIYYGNEQGFAGECREGMFTGSFRSEGTVQTRDYFDQTNDWFIYFQNLTKMRKENKVFRYNTLYVLDDTDDAAGLFAYVVREKDENGNVVTTGTKNKAIYIMNTSSIAKVLDAKYTNLLQGEKFTLLSDVSACEQGDSLPDEFTINEGGKVNLVIPGNSYGIYLLTETGVEVSGSEHTVSIVSVPTEEVQENEISISGKTSYNGTVRIVLNGDYSNSTEVNATANTEFTQTIDISALSNGKVSVQMIFESEDGFIIYSSQKSFNILRPFKLLKDSCVTDPIGDDNGVGLAKGKVTLPSREEFKGQMDIVGVDVYRSGNDIRLGVKMDSISKTWNPTANIFDHVIFNIFIGTPEQNGCTYHSGYNYELPNNFKWDFMYQPNGWGSSYYSKEGASLTSLGKAITPSPTNTPVVNYDKDTDEDGMIELNWENYTPTEEWQDESGMIWFTISASSLGYPKDITGYKIYINTYDFDMGAPRGMVEGEHEEWKFGTAISLEDTPRVIDELDTIIEIK